MRSPRNCNSTALRQLSTRGCGHGNALRPIQLAAVGRVELGKVGGVQGLLTPPFVRRRSIEPVKAPIPHVQVDELCARMCIDTNSYPGLVSQIRGQSSRRNPRELEIDGPAESVQSLASPPRTPIGRDHADLRGREMIGGAVHQLQQPAVDSVHFVVSRPPCIAEQQVEARGCGLVDPVLSVVQAQTRALSGVDVGEAQRCQLPRRRHSRCRSRRRRCDRSRGAHAVRCRHGCGRVRRSGSARLAAHRSDHGPGDQYRKDRYPEAWTRHRQSVQRAP